MKQKATVLLTFLIVCLIPAFGQEQPFYFIALADTQFGMYAADKNFEQETANYEFAVATVNRLRPKFAIVLGDLVNKVGDADQIREFWRISRKIDSSIPVYYVAGNHDVGPAPSPETLTAYRKNIGRDYYSFREGPIYGIVLDSSLIHSPQNAEAEYEAQISWLKKEMENAKASDARQTIVFQHHPYFLKEAKEPDAFGNIPLERRGTMLELLHKYDVHYVFAGHIHSNSVGEDGALEMVAVGPVSMPFGKDGSGMLIAAVTADGVQYNYYDFGHLPNKATVSPQSKGGQSLVGSPQ
jgi:3',5'-cyclic AMP phosphodiesterase CpdA